MVVVYRQICLQADNSGGQQFHLLCGSNTAATSEFFLNSPSKVCHKCAVRFEPVCANLHLFNTEPDCLSAGLIVGKLLTFKCARTREILSDPHTLNQ